MAFPRSGVGDGALGGTNVPGSQGGDRPLRVRGVGDRLYGGGASAEPVRYTASLDSETGLMPLGNGERLPRRAGPLRSRTASRAVSARRRLSTARYFAATVQVHRPTGTRAWPPTNSTARHQPGRRLGTNFIRHSILGFTYDS